MMTETPNPSDVAPRAATPDHDGNRAGSAATADVLLRTMGSAGRITLNRPRAINALSSGMIDALHGALDQCEEDGAIEIVVLDGAGERGLCAGADIREVAAASPAAAYRYFEREYALDLRLAEFPKPVVAIMDGITMGGGVGLSAHGSIRVVTERSRVAMPEVRIGLTPDVGAALLLAHAPGGLGEYLALTAAEMTGADALLCGFADYFLESPRLSELYRVLADSPAAAVATRVWELTSPAPAAPLLTQRDWIDTCFEAHSVDELLDLLAADGSEAARTTRRTILGMCPTSIRVAFEAVRRARDLSLAEVLKQDLRAVTALHSRPDFAEGVRAQVIDKDRQPRWNPASLDEVSSCDVVSILGKRTVTD